MTDTLFDVDLTLEVIIAEEIEKMPPCEGPTHPVGKFGHVPETGAAFIVILPCGNTPMMCQGWVDHTLNFKILDCAWCNSEHRFTEVSFVSLDITHS